ncbi:MAG TPA: GNAT family N-acetyltransferase [Frankiaceae bacterium]|nr:GNAT family N-acetyltransferase [Frankiaceae bacterium]
MLARDGPALAAAVRLRRAVFVDEQGIDPAVEADGQDPDADHAVVLDGVGEALATARLLDRGRTAVLGRVAVRRDARGRGLGTAVTRRLEHRAAERGLPAVEVHAQAAVEGFYRRQGYLAHGEPYFEAGLEHVSMRKELLPGLRPVRDEDGPALVHLIGSVWAEYPGMVLDVDREEPWLRAPASARAAAGAALWVVADVRACIGLRPLRPGAVELTTLYVAATRRRQGWGARLVWWVERAARERGAGRVELWSDRRFADAHRLYERLGYRATGGTRELHDLSGTVERPFAKDLPPPA